MRENDCDLALIYGDDRAFSGAGNVRYLCDYAPHFEPAFFVIAATGQPVLVTGPECRDYARVASRCSRVFSITDFALAGQCYPFVDLKKFRDVLSDLAGSAKRIRKIALGGVDVIPMGPRETLKAGFPRAKFVDAGGWMVELRMVKSAAEIAIIRRAYQIADAGMRACIGAIRPGVSEHEVAAEGEYAMRRLGAERAAIDTIVGSGPNSRPIIVRSTPRKIRKGDLVVLSIGPRFQGYHAALGRPVYVGSKVPAGLRKATDVARQALEKTRLALKPGAVGEAVEAVGRNHVRKAGLGKYYVYSSCHSVGTVEAEEPVLGPGSRLVVRPNMVFNIDIPLFLAPFGGFRYEDGFLVTGRGNERLNRTALDFPLIPA